MSKSAVGLIVVLLAGCVTSGVDLNDPAASKPETKLSLIETIEPLSDFQGHSVFDTLYVAVGYGQSDIEEPLDAAAYMPRHVPLELKDRLISQISALALFADVKPTRSDTTKPRNGYLVEILLNPTITLPVASKIRGFTGLGLIDVELDTNLKMVAQTRLHRVVGDIKLLEDRYQVTGTARSSTFSGFSDKGSAGSPSAWAAIMDRMTPHIVNIVARGAIVDSVARAPNRQAPAQPKAAIAPQPAKAMPARPTTASTTTTTAAPAADTPLPALPTLPDLPSLK